MGSVWVSGDLITAARMNQKTVLVDTGANINSVTKYAGMLMYCTSAGNGYEKDHIYQVEADGSTITDLGSRITVPTGAVVYTYSTTIGDYTSPTAATVSSTNNATTNQTSDSGYTGNHANTWTGSVIVVKFTGMTPGDLITKVAMFVMTAAGNIRVKVYADDGAGGDPGTLLAESNSTAASGSGAFQDISLISSATVPASGNIYAGFECDSNTLDLDRQTSEPAGTSKLVAHSYGAGPTPFGTPSNVTYGMRVRITYTHQTYAALYLYDGNTSTEWRSNSEVHPNAYVQISSAADQTPSGIAIYYDSATTATQIEIDISPDGSTWTTVRTINTSLLTNGAWNYIRWSLSSVLAKYVRIYATDAGSVILAIYEIKVLKPTTQQLALLSGHKIISTSDGTLALTT